MVRTDKDETEALAGEKFNVRAIILKGQRQPLVLPVSKPTYCIMLHWYLSGIIHTT